MSSHKVKLSFNSFLRLQGVLHQCFGCIKEMLLFVTELTAMVRLLHRIKLLYHIALSIHQRSTMKRAIVVVTFELNTQTHTHTDGENQR